MQKAMNLTQRIVSAARDGRILAGVYKRLVPFDSFLRECRGVIHVGANEGGERDEYAKLNLNVIWIEPLPETYAVLTRNIIGIPNQRAINALVTDVDGAAYTFHVADNGGQSSSIFEPHLHKEAWPEVGFTHEIHLTSSRLPTLLAGANLERYDALVLDAQGAELLILKGAEPILKNFRYLQIEAADFEAYRGGATTSEITEFLTARGFQAVRKRLVGRRPIGGEYHDLLFKRLR